MNFIKRHIEYFKDNPKGYWFKRKLYGWGWTPVRWQGWLVVAFFVLFLIWTVSGFAANTAPTDVELLRFFTKIIMAVSTLILICYKAGESPRWQWGMPVGDSLRNTQMAAWRPEFINFAVFFIFFGIALFEAFRKGNALEALFFLSLGALSFWADFSK